VSAQRYRVKAALVMVKVPNHSGSVTGGAWTFVQIYAGGIVPADAEETHFKHLIDSNLVEPIGV
jgi:hypothetical protein